MITLKCKLDPCISSLHENKVQSPGHGYEVLCDPSSSNSLMSYYLTSLHSHLYSKSPSISYLSGQCLLVLQDSNQASSRRKDWPTLPVSPQHLLKHISDWTKTVLLHHTETSRARTVSHLSLHPWYRSHCLAHKEALWLFRMKDEFSLLSFCFILIYTHWSGNN